MGSAQSYLTPETAITAGIIVAGAIALGTSQRDDATTTTPATGGTASSNSKSSKKKSKKSKASAATATSDTGASVLLPTIDPKPSPVVVAAPTVVPGGFADSHESSAAEAPDLASSAAKKRKGKKKAKAPVDTPSSRSTPQPSGSPVPPSPKNSTASLDTDSSWTRVESSRHQLASQSEADADAEDGDIQTTSDDDLPGTDHMQSSSGSYPPVTENRTRTLAEKMLPKPRKTGVEDMLQKPDYPTLARVVKVKPSVGEQPAAGFSWGDYEDVSSFAPGASTGTGTNDDDNDDGGWGVVKGRGGRTSNRASGSTIANVTTSAPTAPGDMSKKQRQNAKKRDAAKAAKVEGERDRVNLLRGHKSELERMRMIEQATGRGKESKGQVASLDAKGKMVWD